MILELAEECSANFIITGNSNDFIFSEYKQTKILSPKAYWENHSPFDLQHVNYNLFIYSISRLLYKY